MAASVASSEHSRVPFTFGMGQGKTWVALLLAEWHAKKNKKVCIVTLNRTIQKQFQALLIHYCSNSVDVRRAKMLDFDYQADVFICDEADELIEKCAVIFSQVKDKNNYSLYGLASVFSSKKAYFMSAQFDPYQIQLLRDAFCFE